MSDYDDAIRLDAGDDPGRRTGTFSQDWMIGNAVNGGFVMAAGLSALGQHLAIDPAERTPHSDPVVMSAYFMTASAPGPFTVTTEVMRCGRKLSPTGQVSVSQAGPDGEPIERMRAIASFGNLEHIDTLKQSTPPDLPPPERCVSADQAPPEFLANMRFLERLDLRLDPATAGWALGKPSMKGEIRGWLRVHDREPDTTLLMMALDSLPPVAFDLGILGWTPTLEFTGHIRRRPAPGWLRVSLSSENVGGGMMEEDASIWDSTGALVAQSRQLCGVRLSTGRDG